MSDDESAPVILPIGHYMGPFHPARGAPPKHYIVRIGWDTPKLPDEAHMDIWALAHGLPDRIEDTPWTRQAIVDVAHEAGMADAESIIDTLLGLGVLAEVRPGTEQAVEFARGYRMQSLLVGLGNAPDDPVLDGIGLPGLAPLLKVRPRVFEIWQWGHLWPSLWSACEGLAEVARETAEGEEADADPERMLEFMLGALRTLISRNAIYLDTATTITRSDT